MTAKKSATPLADAFVLVMTVAALMVLAFAAGVIAERDRHHCPEWPVTPEDFRVR